MRRYPIWEREERHTPPALNENNVPLCDEYSRTSGSKVLPAAPDCFLCSVLQSQNDRMLEINQNLLNTLDNSLREKEEIKKSLTERPSGPLCKIIQKKREEIDRLKTELQMSLRENADLQWKQRCEKDKNSEDQRGRIEYLEKRLEQSKAESDSKDGDILKLNDGVTRLQSELDELRHKLKEEQSKVFWLTVDSEHSIRRKTQTDNKKTTELEVENLRFEVRILKTENKKLEEKRRRILQEKEDLSLMHSRELKLREEEIKVLIRDKEKTKLELQSLYVKNKEYEKNLKKTNQDSEIRCLKDQVNDLKKEIHILEKQADNLREEKIQIHRENEKKLKLADQNSSEIRYLKEQVCNLKKEVHTLEKEAESLKEEKIPVQRKGETHLKQTDSRAHRPGSEIDRLKQVILQLEYENEKHKSHISTISGAKENALQRQSQAELNIKTLEEEIQRLRERLLKQEDDNYRLQKEISEVCKEKDNALSRLSKVAGAKLYHGNAAVTDLSDSNRPTKIAEKFSELYDNQWTDAFEELKNTYNTEEETIQVLLNILQEAYTFCMKAENYYETRIDEAVFTLTDINTEETRRINGTNSSIQKALADLRLSMGNACSSIIGQMFLAKLPAILKKKLDVSVSPKTKLYARQCANLCWRMRIRLPPVFARFEFGKGTTFNTDILRKYTKTGGYLDFVVWPALYLHENGPVLSKGVAQPKHFP